MRALPLREASAITVRHEIEALVRDRARVVAPVLIAALRDLQASVSLEDLARYARQSGVGARVEKAGKAPSLEEEAERTVGRASSWAILGSLRAGRKVAAGQVPPRLSQPAGAIGARLDVTERAARWAEKRSADLVVGVSNGAREAMRNAIARSIRSGLHVDGTAKLLRDIVPLDERRAAAVVNYRNRLFADGMDDARAEKAVGRYALSLAKQRAETIARTESFKALNEGRVDLWREMASEGAVPGSKVVKEWQSARDERLCEICEGLDGTTTGLDGEFPGGYGVPPDAHPNCRCALLITVDL